MEKVVRKFTSFKEAEAADDAYYASLTGDERLQIQLELLALHPDSDQEFQKVCRIRKLKES